MNLRTKNQSKVNDISKRLVRHRYLKNSPVMYIPYDYDKYSDLTNEENLVLCFWFDKNGSPHNFSFAKADLIEADKDNDNVEDIRWRGVPKSVLL